MANVGSVILDDLPSLDRSSSFMGRFFYFTTLSNYGSSKDRMRSNNYIITNIATFNHSCGMYLAIFSDISDTSQKSLFVEGTYFQNPTEDYFQFSKKTRMLIFQFGDLKLVSNGKLIDAKNVTPMTNMMSNARTSP